MFNKGVTISGIINAQLERQKRSMNWLSEETGIPYRTIWRKLKTDGSSFNLLELAYIATALSIKLSALFEELERQQMEIGEKKSV